MQTHHVCFKLAVGCDLGVAFWVLFGLFLDLAVVCAFLFKFAKPIGKVLEFLLSVLTLALILSSFIAFVGRILPTIALRICVELATMLAMLSVTQFVRPAALTLC